MAIRAVIFDLGGVLIEIDWARYRKDEQPKRQANDLYPYDYEQLNADLAAFVSDLRPDYKTATICNGGSSEAVNRKFRLGELRSVLMHQ